VLSVGISAFRTDSGWARKSSRHGSDTTRAAMFSACSFSAASHASETSEPLATSTTCGFAGLRTT
jgi:hypothetical protein